MVLAWPQLIQRCLWDHFNLSAFEIFPFFTSACSWGPLNISNHTLGLDRLPEGSPAHPNSKEHHRSRQSPRLAGIQMKNTLVTPSFELTITVPTRACPQQPSQSLPIWQSLPRKVGQIEAVNLPTLFPGSEQLFIGAFVEDLRAESCNYGESGGPSVFQLNYWSTNMNQMHSGIL
jgi:hypothetical protein